LREDLKPIEQARAFRTLIDRRRWSYRQLSDHLHVAPASVARALALLELPEDLQVRVEAGELAPSVAYEVSRLEDHDDQREVAARVVSEDLSRAEAVEAVRQAAGRSTVKQRGGGAIKARPKRPTVRTIKTTAAKVTVEFKRAVDLAEVIVALREATAKLEAEQGATRPRPEIDPMNLNRTERVRQSRE
jgi:ParB family chromosome partitioning protein